MVLGDLFGENSGMKTVASLKSVARNLRPLFEGALEDSGALLRFSPADVVADGGSDIVGSETSNRHGKFESYDPGMKYTIKDNGAYSMIVVQGKGRMNKLNLDCSKPIRFHEMTEDEVFCAEAPARVGVVFQNMSEVAPLTVIHYFGPDFNPDAPKLGAYKQNKF